MHIRFHDNDIRYVTIYFNHFPRHILRIFDFPIYCKHVANVPKKSLVLRSVPKVQNWVAKTGSCSTMSVLCWIKKGRRLLRFDRDESFAFLRQQPGDSGSFFYSQMICKTIQLSTHLENKRLLILSTFDIINLKKGLRERLWWRK